MLCTVLRLAWLVSDFSAHAQNKYAGVLASTGYTSLAFLAVMDEDGISHHSSHPCESLLGQR